MRKTNGLTCVASYASWYEHSALLVGFERASTIGRAPTPCCCCTASAREESTPLVKAPPTEAAPIRHEGCTKRTALSRSAGLASAAGSPRPAGRLDGSGRLNSRFSALRSVRPSRTRPLGEGNQRGAVIRGKHFTSQIPLPYRPTLLLPLHCIQPHRCRKQASASA